MTDIKKLICDLHAMTVHYWIDTDTLAIDKIADKLDDDWQQVIDENGLDINFREAWDEYAESNF